jgi:hypothetical protein
LNRHSSSTPPWEFLLSASRTSLQSYELSRLSHAANVRKEIAQLLDVDLEESANAMLARCLMERRQDVEDRAEARRTTAPGQAGSSAGEPSAQPAQAASDNFLAEPLSEPGVLPPRIRGVLRRRACA